MSRLVSHLSRASPVMLAPAILCHIHRTSSGIQISLNTLVLFDIRAPIIVIFRAWKPIILLVIETQAGSLWHKRAGASNTMILSTNKSQVSKDQWECRTLLPAYLHPPPWRISSVPPTPPVSSFPPHEDNFYLHQSFHSSSQRRRWWDKIRRTIYRI